MGHSVLTGVYATLWNAYTCWSKTGLLSEIMSWHGAGNSRRNKRGTTLVRILCSILGLCSFGARADVVLTTLHSFQSSHDGSNCVSALVQGGDSSFYGTTIGGGAYDGGTVFKINAAGVLTLRTVQDSNKLLASLLEQQTIASKQQREMATDAINAEVSRQSSLSTNLNQVTGTLTSSLQNFRMP